MTYVDDQNGRTALLLASKSGHADVAKLLLDKGAKIDVTSEVGPIAFVKNTIDRILKGILIGKKGQTAMIFENDEWKNERPKEMVEKRKEGKKKESFT